MFSTKDKSLNRDRERSPRVGPRRSLAIAGLGLLVSLLLALLVYGTAWALGERFVVTGPQGEIVIPIPAVVLASAVGAAGAWAIAQIASRTPRPRMVFAVLIALGIAASSIPPFSASSPATTAWLLLMHAVVAVPLIGAAVRILPVPSAKLESRLPSSS